MARKAVSSPEQRVQWLVHHKDLWYKYNVCDEALLYKLAHDMRKAGLYSSSTGVENIAPRLSKLIEEAISKLTRA